MIIVLIGAVQVYNLTGYSGVRGLSLGSAVYFRARVSQSITLILAVVAITILLSGEEINRGVKRKAYIDSTGIMNKNACMERMNLLDNKDSTLNIGFVMFDLNNLKQVNDDWGHEEGDKLIQNFVLLLRQASNKEYFLARFGGDEFVAIIENCTEAMMKSYLKRIEELTGHFNRAQEMPISYACGFAISTKEHYYLMDDLLKEADKKMYENKKKMKSVDLAPARPGRAPRAGRAGAAERQGPGGPERCRGKKRRYTMITTSLYLPLKMCCKPAGKRCIWRLCIQTSVISGISTMYTAIRRATGF